MHRLCCPSTRRVLKVLCAVTLLVAPSVLGQQPLRATVLQVEGATQTWHVTDKDGKIVEVDVPSQSSVDIQTSQEQQSKASGTAGPVTGTVQATVVAVDTRTNRVKVQTQAGQVIELATAATDRQIGEQVTLTFPTEGTKP